MSLRSALVAVLAGALMVSAVGLPLLPMLSPAFTQTLSQRYSLSAEAGLSSVQMLSLAEDVRAFVAAERDSLPARVQGRDAFDEGAVSHLRDVRSALAAGRLATLAAFAAALLCVWLLRRDRLAVRRAFGAASLVSSALIAAVGMIGLFDFDRFFSAFHGLFFEAGTWTFSYDSLLIQLFPERFWLVSAVSWAVGTLVLSAIFGCIWFVLGRKGASKREPRLS